MERIAAIEFLDEMSEDVPDLLEDLVEMTMCESVGTEAQRAIARRKHLVKYAVREIALVRSETADKDDFERLALLLDHLRDTEGLRLLVERARLSDDPDIQEVADDFDPA